MYQVWWKSKTVVIFLVLISHGITHREISNFLGPQAVSFVERFSCSVLIWRVPYWMLHCIYTIIIYSLQIMNMIM